VSRKSWLDQRILVTVGTGGVGKTTLAAALGLAGARAGKRTLVLTIDPAQRLADALGIGKLDHTPREIPAELLAADGIAVSGSLSAMMLDTKRTFDELVERYAPDEEVIAQILANPIYLNLTDALAGSREYSAMEKLFQLHSDGKYDLIVLDTPPASHALNFLDAPRRLTGFLDSQILRLLFRPAIAMGRTGFRLFRFGSNTVLQAMERITGMEFLRMVSEFLLVFESLWEGVASRAHEIEVLLRDPTCGFVLVVGPDPVQARRAEEFWGRLEQERIHLRGVVLNRVRIWPGDGEIPRFVSEDWAEATRTLLEQLASDASEDVQAEARALVDAVARYASLAQRDRAMRGRMIENLRLDAADVRVVPLFPEDVHALDALGTLSRYLLPGAGG